MAALITVTPATKRYPQRIGTRLEWNGKITLPASYDGGGSVLSPKLLGMNTIEGGVIGSSGANAYELLPQPDGTAKIKAVVMSTGVEVAGAVNLSAITPYASILGH